MPLEETLRKVDYDISRGDLEKARQRLTGLLWYRCYPSNLLVRRKLGDLNWQLGNVIEAGRYWYLEEVKTPEMVEACKRFEKAYGHNPQRIGRRLKFHGDLYELRKTNSYATYLLKSLQEQARIELGNKPPFVLQDSSYRREYYRDLIKKSGRKLSSLARKLKDL